MNFSAPSLHARVFVSSEHKAAIVQQYATAAAIRSKEKLTAPSPDSIQIPLTAVSLNEGDGRGSFDAYINISFQGPTSNTPFVTLLLDSGNSTLIVPSWESIQNLPGYTVLADGTKDGFTEPWGCPANIVMGPINITDQSGNTVCSIPNCVFYACTGPGDASDPGRTANFGAACLSPWSASGWNNPTNPKPPYNNLLTSPMQAPLSYLSYPYAEFNYAPAMEIYGSAGTPKLTTSSSLVLYTTLPAGYATTFSIIKDLAWMALTAKALTIGAVRTAWPAGPPPPSAPPPLTPMVAMIDTGGGPVFLSDSDGYVCDRPWPDPVQNPCWTSDPDPKSTDCESISGAIAITLGDDTDSISYIIDPSLFPPSVQNLTLVMCKVNGYMRNLRGMNIGGISALVNYILVDYKNCRVGLKPKLPAPAP